MRIDVYDFDGTIYDSDSTVDLRGSACAVIPPCWRIAPVHRTSVLLALGRRNLTQFKSVLFGEMAKRFSLEKEAELFWQDERTRQAGAVVFDPAARSADRDRVRVAGV
ncbi:MAG: hypothetical protein ACLUI3_17355 [Christensenellales bacterium]